MKLLSKEFYENDPKFVAANLLGKLLLRSFHRENATGVIVETEAYYGMSDPASRASKGMTNLSMWLWQDAGTVFVYTVHGYNLLNIITKRKGEPSGVLIRAVEPRSGVEIMRRNRNLRQAQRAVAPSRSKNVGASLANLLPLTSGPGKLTQALAITKIMNGLRVYDEASPIRIYDIGIRYGKEQVGRSHRIGVRHDLEEKLRFFVKDSMFVSRR